MYKSRDNGNNHLDLTAKFGTDAFRIDLIVGNAPGTPLALDENRIRGYRNFANKVWNASRFVLMNLTGFNPKTTPRITPTDKKILNDLRTLTKQITNLMDSFRFYKASENLYHYFWHTFADKILEDSKEALKNKKTRTARQYVLLSVLKDLLKLLHPFIPFVTEELYQQLPSKNKKESIMIEKWPV